MCVMSSIVVDRIEGSYAVLDVAGTMVDLPVGDLPKGAGEGSVLELAMGLQRRIRTIRGRCVVLDVAGESLEFPLSAFPKGIRPGSRIVFTLGDNSTILSEAEARLERLKQRNTIPDDDVFEL